MMTLLARRSFQRRLRVMGSLQEIRLRAKQMVGGVVSAVFGAVRIVYKVKEPQIRVMGTL